MSDPFLGEIRMFAGNFAPRGWAFCDGQLLAVSQNDALFSLFGTIYGGDGRTTFGLPDMRGRVPVHHGSGPGLSNRPQGAKGGSENEMLTTNQLPQHSHTMQASSDAGTLDNPTNAVVAVLYHDQSNQNLPAFDANTNASMKSDALTNAGGSQSHVNMMPFLAVNFIVSLVGVYPSRS